VTRFGPGDRVAVAAGVHCGECDFCRAGGFTMRVYYHILSEHTSGVHAGFPVVPAGSLVPVPEGVARETAAAALLVFGTAWRVLVTRGATTRRVCAGARCERGRRSRGCPDRLGAEVYATASSAGKRS
jgi:D-arabinose 1-dehydrogenase-like Zn-dependent alcohol dehydrogenase